MAKIIYMSRITICILDFICTTFQAPFLPTYIRCVLLKSVTIREFQTKLFIQSLDYQTVFILLTIYWGNNCIHPVSWGCRLCLLHFCRGVIPPPLNECPEYGTKLHLMVKFNPRTLGNMEYPFIAITPRFTLTQSSSTC